MQLFSERYNLIKRTEIQKGFLEEGTRNLLWNELLKKKMHLEQNYYDFVKYIWCSHLKRAFDNIPYARNFYRISDSFLKNIFMTGQYYEIFDILEIAVNRCGFQNLRNQCNEIFEKENCAYRFVDNLITEITSDTEIKEIEEAINSSAQNINIQLHKAIEHLYDRQNPDYRNSIKESISAVEAICRDITDESTLDRALKKLENKGIVFNSQLKQGLEKIYFYTNSEDGIRHALMDKDTVTKADAKFMLVMCCAFINYIKENQPN